MGFKKPQYNAYDLQDKSDGKHFYIARCGQFYHAFGDCARLIAYNMKYKLSIISNANYKDGTVRVGFPIDSLQKVIDSLITDGLLKVEKQELDLIVLVGELDIPHVEPVATVGVGNVSGDILGDIISINIAETTPLQALKKLGELQNECKKLMNI